MTPEMIERFANNAGWRVDTYTAGSKRTLTMVTPSDLAQVMRFAALVAAHEREQAALVCDRLTMALDHGGKEYRREASASSCAAAIRGRTG